MENLKYFTYGYPEHPALPTYALYQPVLDCFLITTHSQTVATQIRMLLNSRYNLYTVCLNTADNYSYNLIDNAICENWTFRGRSSLSVDKFNRIDQVVYADHLELVNHKIDWDIDREKQWCLLCNFYLAFFNTVKESTLLSAKALMEILPNDSFEYRQHPIEQQIMEMLYLETDFKKTDLTIRQLINTDESLAIFFNKFQL